MCFFVLSWISMRKLLRRDDVLPSDVMATPPYLPFGLAHYVDGDDGRSGSVM